MAVCGLRDIAGRYSRAVLDMPRELLAGAPEDVQVDVLVETEAPGRMEQLGLGYEELRARNPGLIYVSVTPFGRDGEWRDWRANDLVAGAAGGLLWVSGSPADPPVQGAANLGDVQKRVVLHVHRKVATDPQRLLRHV